MTCYCGQEVDTPHQDCVQLQLALDRLLLGTSFELRHDDGTVERLDPTEVVMRTREPLT